ncbi:MAG TPA: DUF883 C-terminal domain-containing protein [Candidatus Polarisedimenticolia bacterium]|nr:DUF883 C-terminal domain-containing protein [Candidatus Polarisedimenticolia bacterium]
MRPKADNGHNVNVDVFLEDLKAVVRDGQELLKSSASTFKQRALSSARGTDRVIRQSPYETIGIVLGVGIIIGLLASGTFSRRASSEYEEPHEG